MTKDLLAEKIVEYINCLSVADSMDEFEWNETKDRIYNIVHNSLEKLREALNEDMMDFAKNHIGHVDLVSEKTCRLLGYALQTKINECFRKVKE